jgi:hypothetical protein
MNKRERNDMPWIITAFVLMAFAIVVSGFIVGWR